MSTITILKKEYESLKKDATAWRRVVAVSRNGGTRIPNKQTLKASRDLRSVPKKLKKLPAGLRQALREVEQGKLSGPFHTVDELMAHLRK